MIKFEKVSFEEFYKSVSELNALESALCEDEIADFYEKIKLPQRSTDGSAGYDFFAPFTMTIGNFPLTIPTGIRWVTDRDDIVLLIVPRSGYGFKYGMRLSNTVGVIDSDYHMSDNEGHIKAKILSDVLFTCERGKAFMQGIIVPFLKTDDDSDYDKEVRNGGFGSTYGSTGT